MKLLKVLLSCVLGLGLAIFGRATVPSSTTYAQYVLTSNPQTLAVPFVFLNAADLLVLDSKSSPPVTLTISSDYSVSGGAGSVGSVTTIAGGANAVQVGDTITISRRVPLTQTTSFTNTGPLTAGMIGQALDKLTEITQQINLRTLNSLQFQQDEVISGVLPKSQRKNKFLTFDANGNVNFGVGTVYTASNGVKLVGTDIEADAASMPTLNQSTTGNAATATALQNAQSINGVSFNGTASITVPAAAGTLTGSSLAAVVTAAPGLLSASIGTFGTMATQAASGVAITGGAISNTAITGGTITGLPTPTGTTDAANKAYVDAAAAGITPRTGVVIATTANITRSGEQTIDGVLTSASRILVKNQTAPAENGIFVTAAGAWSRATDSNTAAQLKFGYYYFVSSGTTQAATSWFIATAPTVLNTDPVAFSQFSASQSYAAGTGLGLTGNVFSLNAAQSGLTLTGSAFNGTIGATTPSTVVATTLQSTAIGGITPGTIASTTLSASGQTSIGTTGTGFNLALKDYNTGTARNWTIRDDAGVDRLRFAYSTADYAFWDITKSAGANTVANQLWYAASNYYWNVAGVQVANLSATGLNSTAIGASVPSTGGFTTITSNSNANIRTTKGNFHQTINVKDYGAMGDGVTNDSVAIAAAAAAMTNYSVLYFPAGKYLTSGFTTPTGLNNILVTGENATIYQTTPANTTLLVDRTSSYVVISNLIFDGAASSRLNGCHIRFDATHGLIKNVVVAHCSDFGMFIGQHNNATPTKDVQIIGCRAFETKGDGFHMDNVNGVQVVGCVAWDTGDDAFAAVGYESAAAQAMNISITGCRAYSTGGIGFRGLALLMVKGVTVSDFRAENMVGAGIEVGDGGNNVGVFNEDVVIRNSDLTNSITTAGPYAACNLYFTKRCTLENVTVRDPLTASCIAIADFDDLQVSNCDVIVTRAGFCRGIVMNPGATINGRTVRTTWTNLNLANFHFNLKQADNNEAIYLDPDASVSVVNAIITGAVGSQVPTGNYIVTGRLATAAKIGNNTCLQGRAVASTGTGIAATTFNNQ